MTNLCLPRVDVHPGGQCKWVSIFFSALLEKDDAAEGNGVGGKVSLDLEVLASGNCPGRKRGGERAEHFG